MSFRVNNDSSVPVQSAEGHPPFSERGDPQRHHLPLDVFPHIFRGLEKKNQPAANRDEAKKDANFFENSKVLIEVGKSDEAWTSAKSIRDVSLKNEALCHICEILTKRGDTDKAREVAKSIDDDDKNSRDKVLWDISKALTQAGKIHKAMNLVRSMINDVYIIKCAFFSIWNALKKEELVTKALALADGRKDEISSIFQALTHGDKTERPRKIAESISDKDCKDHALYAISETSIKKGELDNALAAAKLISNQDMKNGLLSEIQRKNAI